MPEGHSLRRLAIAFEQWFVGSRCHTSSPQGRFVGGAAVLDGMIMTEAQSVGKHLFLRFSNSTRPAQNIWLHVHLGLYGSWRFYGTPSAQITPSIGAPRLPDVRHSGNEGFGVTSSNGEVAALDREDEASDVGDSGGDAFQMIAVAAQVGPDSNEGVRLDLGFAEKDSSLSATWTPPPPRGAVRLRIVTDTVAADLSGPTRCEVLDAAGVETVLERLGPDPLDNETSPEMLRTDFVDRVRASRRTVGELVMDQGISAGVGNIYRAEALFRQGISPHRKGINVSAARLGKLWDDFVFLLNEGVTSGRIRTLDANLISDQVQAEDPESKKWFVYKRAGYQCLVCGAPVRTKTMVGRNLFWCSSCQR